MLPSTERQPATTFVVELEFDSPSGLLSNKFVVIVRYNTHSFSRLPGGNPRQSRLATIVIPIHLQAVHPENANLALNIGIETHSAQFVEEVVEGDLRELTILEIGARRNWEMLGRNDVLALSDIVPLVCSSNEITGDTPVCGTVVAAHISRVHREPVIVVICARPGAK